MQEGADTTEDVRSPRIRPIYNNNGPLRIFGICFNAPEGVEETTPLLDLDYWISDLLDFGFFKYRSAFSTGLHYNHPSKRALQQ